METVQHLYSKCLPSPVRQKEGTDVRYRWSSRPKLCQCHDVLEGDVRLRADIHCTHILRRAAVVMSKSSCGSGWGSPENLDNDGFPPDGLHHCLVMVNFGELTCIHLLEEDTKSLLDSLSSLMVNVMANRYKPYSVPAPKFPCQ